MTIRDATRAGRGREDEPPPLSASTAIIPQRVIPMAILLAAQTLVALGIIGAVPLHRPGWSGAAMGLAVALIVMLPVRGGSLSHRAAQRLVFRYDSRRRGQRRSDAFDTQLPGSAAMGFHWDRQLLMSVIRIDQDASAMTIMEPAAVVSGQTIPLRLLAECLRQFDVSLDSVDVIGRGVRLPGRNPIQAAYDAVLGPLPAIAARTVCVVIRVDPDRCPDAVRRRGGGWEGVLRTAATATSRVANRLVEAGLRCRVLGKAEIAELADELSAGLDPQEVQERWAACHQGRFELRTFFLKPSMFTEAGLGQLWTVPTQATTVCLSLRREDRSDGVKLRGLVRFETYGRVRARLDGLGELPGRQRAAWMSTLPVPPPRRPLRHWVFGRGLDSLVDLAVPASGCGQLIGADELGRAVALPLFGPGVRRVEMCGTLHLAQQVVLRSVALGARVRVNTSRPAAWHAMSEQIADHDLLDVNGHHVEPAASDQPSHYGVELFDGVAERRIPDTMTMVVVRPWHAQPTENADVTLRLLDNDRDLVRVDTHSGSAVVTMVATDDEMRYIGSSFAMAG
ncbi:type VII secretion protein EccE [Mycobacterium sp. 050134]|uniref:type VII secretion protein EccE n=1 Tax=Mycobacterium sp. 050134 TaxID=3096111 RepID=UPI002EDA46E1